MDKFEVTVNFTRKNAKGLIEKSERSGEFYATNKDKAKELYMSRFVANEPKFRQIQKITVRKIK